MKKIYLIVLTLILFSQAPVMAYEWKTDPAHSEIVFEIRHIYSTIRGHFNDFKGEIYFDPRHPDKSRFEFTVKVDSIDTRNGKRDTHLRSDDFFAAGKFPAMTFKSSRVTHAGGNRYLLEGRMTVKDVSRDLTVEFVYWGEKENPFNKKQMVAGFDARLAIDRLAYHVGDGKFYQMGVVGKDVDVLISLEVLRDR